jgi:UDP-N-acetylglucosamine 3-dehydrogenase
MINIGLIGAGYIGGVHSEAIKKINNAKITAVTDIIEERGRKLANSLNARYFKNTEDMLAGDDINAVFICTPDYTHVDIFKKAANAKKDIFCEKPLALSVKEVDQMMESIKKNKIRVMVGHVLRFWPEYVKAKEIVDSGIIGKPLSVFCERLVAFPKWTEWYGKEEFSKGAALNLQIHDLDYLIFLLGTPRSVFSQGVYKPDLGGWSHMNTVLDFNDNVKGLVDDGWTVKGKFPFTMVLRIICEKGSIDWIFRAGENLEERAQQSPITLYKSDGSAEVLEVSKEDPYFLEAKYFIDCLEEGRDINNATLEDGKKSLELALASIESAKTNRVVQLK